MLPLPSSHDADGSVRVDRKLSRSGSGNTHWKTLGGSVSADINASCKLDVLGTSAPSSSLVEMPS